jgi:hypothetical protein
MSAPLYSQERTDGGRDLRRQGEVTRAERPDTALGNFSNPPHTIESIKHLHKYLLDHFTAAALQDGHRRRAKR